MPSRGCGSSRDRGAIYLMGATSPFGRPFRDFMFCPPKHVTREEMRTYGWSAIGQNIVDGNVLDVIGANSYPTPAHWIVECEQRGGQFSRRAPSNLDFRQLKPGAKLFAMHYRAWMLDPHLRLPYMLKRERYQPLWDNQPYCPVHNEEHRRMNGWSASTVPMCTGLYWEDMEPGSYPPVRGNQYSKRAVLVSQAITPDITFHALNGLPDYEGNYIKPAYDPAIFGAWPIGHIEVVRDGTRQRKHERALEAASLSGLECQLVEE